MNYQEQQVVSFSVVTIMTILMLTYVLSIVVGLFILYGEIKEDIKPAVIHNTKQISLTKKAIPPKPKPQPEVPVIDPEDLKILARIINAEAGNQPYEGKLAVGNVIMNRVNHPKFPDTIREVVYQKGQFSPVTDGSINKEPNDESIQAAKEVLSGKTVVHKDVLFFYNPDISTSKWIFTRKVVAVIGSHAFAI